VATLRESTRRALEDADERARMEGLFLDVEHLTPPEVREHELRTSQVAPLIKRLDIRSR